MQYIKNEIKNESGRKNPVDLERMNLLSDTHTHTHTHREREREGTTTTYITRTHTHTQNRLSQYK